MTKIMPKIDSISPTSGPAGTPVTITGSGFVDGNNLWGVFFNGVPTHNFVPEQGDEASLLYLPAIDDGSAKRAATLAGWVVVDDNTILALAPVGADGEPPITGTVAVLVKTEGGSENFGNGPVDSTVVDFTYTT